MTVHDGREEFGRYYEEFEVGDVFKHWPGRTITEYDDVLHCMQTMNHHPLHIDARYAEEETQFGKNVVVGTLVYSIIFGMTVTEISGKAIANLEVESLKHTAPTFHGNTVYAATAASSPSTRAATTSAAKPSSPSPARSWSPSETRASSSCWRASRSSWNRNPKADSLSHRLSSLS